MAKYVTNQRKILLEYLCAHHDELLSARAIADALAHENISISAVYRNLAELEKSGEVHRVSKSGSREVYYQYTAAGECKECLHLSCKECGKTYHMSMGAAELVTSSIAKSEMFDIDKSDTIIYGVCKGVQEMKKIIKKAICTACVIALSTASVTACGNASSISNDDKISIVATIFPQYDWARQIVGDSQNVSLTLLADNGTDLHSFEPTADDIIAISECDIFIYIGGESDQWVEEALAQAVNKDMIKLNLLESLGDNAEYTETVEGMQHDHSHECEDDDCGHSQAYDEHIWLSLKNADILCNEIAQSIISLCPESKDEFTENLNSYINKLNSLDDEYADFFRNRPRKASAFW